MHILMESPAGFIHAMKSAAWVIFVPIDPGIEGLGHSSMSLAMYVGNMEQCRIEFIPLS